MTGQAQGGLLLIAFAVILALLWTRGYLAAWTGNLVALLNGQVVKRPITFGSAAPGTPLRAVA